MEVKWSLVMKLYITLNYIKIGNSSPIQSLLLREVLYPIG